MSKLSKMHSIEQFRNVIRHVHDATRYQGRAEDGSPIFDPNTPLPKLMFRGTVKLHGTNAAVGVDFNTNEIWAQSKEQIITPAKDNAGFAAFVHLNRDIFARFIPELNQFVNVFEGNFSGAVIYGEWCGGNIQAGVAINGLPKMFVVFSIKLLSADSEEANVWLKDESVASIMRGYQEYNIYDIFSFGYWEEEIDFNNPHEIQNKLVELTSKVEAECPVGKFFNVAGTGEGIVWKSYTPPYIGGAFQFKVKGDKHSSSKVKTIAAVDVEKVNSVRECVDMIVTENRLNQGLEQMRLNNLELQVENLSFFIKWIVADCVKEELDTIVESGLIVKDVNGAISKKARDWFFATTQNSGTL